MTYVGVAQGQSGASAMLFEMRHRTGAGDRDNMRGLMQNPGNGQRRGAATFGGGKCTKAGCCGNIRRQVFCRENAGFV